MVSSSTFDGGVFFFKCVERERVYRGGSEASVCPQLIDLDLVLISHAPTARGRCCECVALKKRLCRGNVT